MTVIRGEFYKIQKKIYKLVYLLICYRSWLGIKNDCKTLIGLEGVNVVNIYGDIDEEEDHTPAISVLKQGCGLLIHMQLKFEPSKWHICDQQELANCERNANCYSYALNNPTYYWAVPGMGFAKTTTGHFLRSATSIFEAFPSDEAYRHALIDGSKKDGLLPTTEPKAPEGYRLVALFISDKAGNRDFHWYRQDDDGTWSHKDGRSAPSNKDDDGNIIQDPQATKHAAYPVFGGYFLAPRHGVALQQTFPMS